jgi:hypothetical protein
VSGQENGSRADSCREQRRYRATLIPLDVRPEDAELKASQGALPFVQFKADNLSKAAAIAQHVTGLPVLHVERFEGLA